MAKEKYPYTIKDVIQDRDLVNEKINENRWMTAQKLAKKAGYHAMAGYSPFMDKADEIVRKDANKEIMGAVKMALSEENPLAGGTYEGSIYYSNILPKGQDTTPWSKEASIIVGNAAKSNATKKDIKLAEDYFISIGYMHPSEKDGMKGKQLNGMIRRWQLNAGTSRDAIFDRFKTWKDSIFD